MLHRLAETAFWGRLRRGGCPALRMAGQTKSPRKAGGKEVTMVENRDTELLRKQLELLAERAKKCMPHELSEVTEAMVSIYKALNPSQQNLP